MKARAAVTIASLCAFTLILCPGVALWAQAAAEAVQAGAPAAQTQAPTPPPQAPAAQPPAPTPQPIMQPVGPSTQDSSNELSVAVGKSVVLDLARPITRIVVGLGDYAEAAAMSPTQVLVNGKAPGETTLILWDTSGGRQFFNVSVRASNFVSNDRLESLRRELRAELPGQPLRVSEEDGNIFVALATGLDLPALRVADRHPVFDDRGSRDREPGFSRVQRQRSVLKIRNAHGSACLGEFDPQKGRNSNSASRLRSWPCPPVPCPSSLASGGCDDQFRGAAGGEHAVVERQQVFAAPGCRGTLGRRLQLAQRTRQAVPAGRKCERRAGVTRQALVVQVRIGRVPRSAQGRLTVRS